MIPLWWMSHRGRLWLLAAPLTVNLLRPLEREKEGGAGGGPVEMLRAVMGLWFGTEDASEPEDGGNSMTELPSEEEEEEIIQLVFPMMDLKMLLLGDA